jgi:hypothetical protein
VRQGESNPRVEVDTLLSEERLEEDCGCLCTGELGASTKVIGTLVGNLKFVAEDAAGVSLGRMLY